MITRRSRNLLTYTGAVVLLMSDSREEAMGGRIGVPFYLRDKAPRICCLGQTKGSFPCLALIVVSLSIQSSAL